MIIIKYEEANLWQAIECQLMDINKFLSYFSISTFPNICKILKSYWSLHKLLDTKFDTSIHQKTCLNLQSQSATRLPTRRLSPRLISLFFISFITCFHIDNDNEKLHTWRLWIHGIGNDLLVSQTWLPIELHSTWKSQQNFRELSWKFIMMHFSSLVFN